MAARLAIRSSGKDYFAYKLSSDSGGSHTFNGDSYVCVCRCLLAKGLGVTRNGRIIYEIIKVVGFSASIYRTRTGWDIHRILGKKFVKLKIEKIIYLKNKILQINY